jgi:ATP-dependent 26S proteasome regulatory subunit
MTPVTEANETIDRLIRARYPIIAINSHEEIRVLRAIEAVVMVHNNKGKNRKIATWSYTQGLNGVDGEEPEAYIEPAVALEFIAKFDRTDVQYVFVMLDLHHTLSQDSRAVRFMRDIFVQFTAKQHNLVLISPALNVPQDLEKNIAVIDYPLPDRDELSTVLENAEKAFQKMTTVDIRNREKIVDALRGLSATEATNVLNGAVIKNRRLDDDAVKNIVAEKQQIVKKMGVLEFVDTKVGMSNVGGLKFLKQYAQIKAAAFTPEAKAAGVDTPKGVLMVGVPGSGKSLLSKAMAGEERLLLRFDAGKLFSRGTVGEASANMRSTIKVIEALAPCYVWIDEIEKGFSDNGGKSDGGEMMRALGTFLTWMQETTADVYMIATANDVTGLRPELLRRFDDIIFVDLPNKDARLEVLRVHLAKRNQKIAAKDLTAVVDQTWGFSGAEIEKVVKSAVEFAFFSKVKLNATHLLDAARKIVPVSVTMKQQIDALRQWAVGRTIPADEPLEAPTGLFASQQAQAQEVSIEM